MLSFDYLYFFIQPKEIQEIVTHIGLLLLTHEICKKYFYNFHTIKSWVKLTFCFKKIRCHFKKIIMSYKENMKAILRNYEGHLKRIWSPFLENLKTVYKKYEGHLKRIWWPFKENMKTIYKKYECHFKKIWWTFTKNTKTILRNYEGNFKKI